MAEDINHLTLASPKRLNLVYKINENKLHNENEKIPLKLFLSSWTLKKWDANSFSFLLALKSIEESQRFQEKSGVHFAALHLPSSQKLIEKILHDVTRRGKRECRPLQGQGIKKSQKEKSTDAGRDFKVKDRQPCHVNFAHSPNL